MLIDTGLRLASAATLDAIADIALEAGRQVSGARQGVCLCCVAEDGNGPTLHCNVVTSGPDGVRTRSHTSLGRLSLERLLNETLRADHLSDTLSADPSLRELQPLVDLLPGQASTRSLLALPIRSYVGKLLAALIYGHPDAAAFGEETASLVGAVATQVGLALDRLLAQKRFEQQAGEAEEARREQRAVSRRLQQVLGAAQLGTWSWDAATGLISFDDRGAELLPVPPGVPILRNRLREHAVLPEDLHRSPADLRAVLAAGGEYVSEYRVGNAADEVRWIAANGRASSEPGQRRFTGMIGTLQDITSRKLQEESLRTSEKLAATGRLAATIAHEINNPLEAVTNLIYLAKTDPVTPPSISRLLETADTELARVSQIAQQTLGFYRDTSRPVSVDLNELLQAVVDLFDRKLMGKRLQCTLDLEPGLHVVGLQGEIRQVVSNLLVNAIDASEANGGRIHIRTRRRHSNGGRGVSVVISDRGSGIPHHVRHRLFTPFTTTKQSLGTGLGLWVTQGMVEKHGGTVRFRSRTASPSGTVFRVYFPESGSAQLFAHQSHPVLQ